MTQETITLPKLAEEVESGYNHYHKKIKMAGWDSFEDFMLYFNQHYRPLLEAVQSGETLDDKQRRLLCFLATDMLEIFGEQ